MKAWLPLAAFFVLAFSRVADATVALQVDGPGLAGLSDTIVHARVVKLYGHVDRVTNRVFTDADIDVVLPLKGASVGERLHVSYPGGVWDGLGMRVEGQIALQAEREYVLYLRKADNGTFLPAAMRQGFYEITLRDNDGVRMAFRSMRGLTLVKRDQQSGLTRVASVPTLREVPLTTLVSDIKRDLAGLSKLDRTKVRGVK